MKPNRKGQGPGQSTIVAHVALLVVTLIAALAWSAGAHCAQPEPLCTEEWRQDVGRMAPCSGVLAPAQTYADLLADRARLTACTEKAAQASELCEADKTLLRTKLDATEKARRACELAHVPTPPPVHKTHWYESAGFAFGVGVVVGVAATIAVVQAAR